MTRARALRAAVMVTLIAVLIIAIAAVFRAYQDPANVAQWLMLLQLCR